MNTYSAVQSANAVCIYEALLEHTRLGIFGGEKATFMASFLLPIQVETFRGARCITEARELDDLYESLSSHLLGRGITDLARRVVAAEFRTPNLIHGTHETRMVQKNVLVSSYVTYTHLCREDGKWWVTDSSYAMGEEAEHAKLLDGRG